MNKFTISLLIIILGLVTMYRTYTQQGNEEKTNDEENWISLFNGKDLEGWTVKIKSHPLGENWRETFKVSDGVIRVDYSNYDTFNESYGHLFYKTPYSDYKFKLDYRFLGEQLKGGENWAFRNSGVMIHCQSPESMQLEQDFPVCLEVQLLGGIVKNEPRSTGNLCTPGTHVSIDGEINTEHCIDSKADTFHGDQWVSLEIEVRNDSVIKHFINGTEVIKYEKPVIGGEYNTLTELVGKPLNIGFIALQSESHPIEFKNIMLLDLNQ